MRNLIMWNLVTLDGYFEGAKPWDLGWHEDVWGDELEELVDGQEQDTGALLFGRRTYEGMASYWTTARGKIADFMNSVPKLVFSRTLAKADWNNTRLVKGDLIEEVSQLKKESGKNLYIFGSADLSSTLVQKRMIDEYRICVTPHLLGTGTQLFKGGHATLKMKLIDARPLKTGAVILRYKQGE